MWLSNSSVGRKFIMALTGAFLVLFVTFHCLMNAVAIFFPAAYNLVCEFLGANWYALVGTGVIAVFVILHIVYALILTVRNRTARGSQRYSIAKRPGNVEWSSQNMLVLGIVVLAFLVVHMIQFWARMQLAEVLGEESAIPAAAGTLFLQEAFATPWTLIVYAIGFLALWFHMNHGFWSMFQSVGWNNTIWMPRLKKISCWWVSIVCGLFLAEGIVFTVNANRHTYLTDPDLRDQYKEMLAQQIEKDLETPGMADQIAAMPFEQLGQQLSQQVEMINEHLKQAEMPEVKQMLQGNPEGQKQLESMQKASKAFEKGAKFMDYLQKYDNKPETQQQQPGQPGGAY